VKGILILKLSVYNHFFPLRHYDYALERPQDRQCTYNVTLRRVRVTIVAVEKQCLLHILIVCSLKYPARNAHASAIVLSVACTNLLYFSTLSHKGHDFRGGGGELRKTKCVF
jgi:hypothetical protein